MVLIVIYLFIITMTISRSDQDKIRVFIFSNSLYFSCFCAMHINYMIGIDFYLAQLRMCTGFLLFCLAFEISSLLNSEHFISV